MTDTETNGYQVKIAILETKLQSMKENLSLQAAEYERRLTELNHAHAQAATDKTKFLNIDIFYAKIAEIEKWQISMGQWRARVIGIAVGSGLASGVVVGMIMRLLA